MLEQGRLDGLLRRVAGELPGVTSACTDSTLSWLMNEAESSPNEPGSAMAPTGMSSTGGLPLSVRIWPTLIGPATVGPGANTAATWLARAGAPGSPLTWLITGRRAAVTSGRYGR